MILQSKTHFVSKSRIKSRIVSKWKGLRCMHTQCRCAFTISIRYDFFLLLYARRGMAPHVVSPCFCATTKKFHILIAIWTAPIDGPLVNDFTLTRNAWVATTPKKAF